jgi:hypothetical protein
MKEILIYLGLVNEPKPTDTYKPPKFYTTVPEDKLTFDEWCAAYRVGMLYDREAYYF